MGQRRFLGEPYTSFATGFELEVNGGLTGVLNVLIPCKVFLKGELKWDFEKGVCGGFLCFLLFFDNPRKNVLPEHPFLSRIFSDLCAALSAMSPQDNSESSCEILDRREISGHSGKLNISI